MAFLEIDNVSKHFPSTSGEGRVCVFQDVTIKIEKGEFVTVIGHSGCGKSTLLNIIAGLDVASEGGVVLGGREISGPGLDRMVVFQGSCRLSGSESVRSLMMAWPSSTSRNRSTKRISGLG